jgi:hypothetical protein
MGDLRKTAEEVLPLLEQLAAKVDPESMDWDSVRKIHNLKVALNKPDEGEWQFKIIGFRTVTLPGGREELQFSVADAEAPKGWS